MTAEDIALTLLGLGIVGFLLWLGLRERAPDGVPRRGEPLPSPRLCG